MEGYGLGSYGDAFADVYDEWYPADAATLAAVDALAALADGGPVLELGCGTGRLCLPLAGRGLAVAGIDASRAMLDRLRAKPGAEAVEVHQADMADFDVGRGRFAVAFAAFNTLFNVTGRDRQAACFAAVARHLRPGGRFVVECFVPGPPPPAVAGDAPPVTDAIELRELSAARVVLRVSRQDPLAQTVSGQHVELSEGGVRLRPWSLHYAAPAELDALAEAAGLAVERRWSSWSGSSFDDDAGNHVTVYRLGGAGR